MRSEEPTQPGIQTSCESRTPHSGPPDVPRSSGWRRGGVARGYRRQQDHPSRTPATARRCDHLKINRDDLQVCRAPYATAIGSHRRRRSRLRAEPAPRPLQTHRTAAGASPRPHRARRTLALPLTSAARAPPPARGVPRRANATAPSFRIATPGGTSGASPPVKNLVVNRRAPVRHPGEARLAARIGPPRINDDSGHLAGCRASAADDSAADEYPLLATTIADSRIV